MGVNRLQRGARNVVRNCMRIGPRDRVVLVTDRRAQREGISRELRNQIYKRGATLLHIRIKRPQGRPIMELPTDMKDKISGFKPTASIFAAQGREGEAPFRIGLVRHVMSLGVRHAHQPYITRRLMETAMQVDYRKIARTTKRVHNTVRNAKRIRVKTKVGTDLTVELHPRLKWVPCTGLMHNKGDLGNLPDGEVFTAPWKINGKVVIDGVLGDWFCPKYGNLEKTPVTVEIKNNHVVLSSIKCENKRLEQDLRKYLRTHRNSRRVGEFAIGTNISLKGLIGNILSDEKWPGVHIAFGDPVGGETGARWKCPTHVDGVLRKTTIIVDGKTIMRDGRFRRGIA